MERKWILSAFVDINGFGTWIYRATIPREIKEPFIEAYLEIVQEYVRQNRNIHFKYLGDGLLAIREFCEPERKDGSVFRFIKGLGDLSKKIERLIKDTSQPPDGLRVRITEGYAYKFKVLDPFDADRKETVPEYIEYGINTAERLMEVNPELVCLVTEGVWKALEPSQRSFFRMRKLGAPSHFPKSVNREDLATLYVIKF